MYAVKMRRYIIVLLTSCTVLMLICLEGLEKNYAYAKKKTPSTIKWRQCLTSIQQQIMHKLSDKLTDKFYMQTPVILVDPAYHRNVGDNMLSYGEYLFMENFTTIHLECGMVQSIGKNTGCGNFEKFKNNSLALWHAGGNWGDVWLRMQTARINSFAKMLKKNMTIIGMPQSLHYNNQELMRKHADLLAGIINNTIGLKQSKHQIILTWRQENSYEEALQLYPFVDNRLVPDIAFMIGPIKNTKIWLNATSDEVDLLFLLRNDKESLFKSERRHDVIKEMIVSQQLNGSTDVSFRIVDWDDRKQFYKPTTMSSPMPMQQIRNKGVFDYNTRFASSVALFASGKVIITDRLHASVFAFLSFKPHVYIDQMYQKIIRTRQVAFNNSTACQDKEALMYTQAVSLRDAVSKGLDMLRKYQLRNFKIKDGISEKMIKN